MVEMSGSGRGSGDGPLPSDLELKAPRLRWFGFYMQQRNVTAPRGDSKYTCPCCGRRNLDERGAYEICPECGWEDDGQDDHDSGVVRGGPNGKLSLDAARAAYVQRGGVLLPHLPPSDAR
jgi:Cysteine-rich CPCC